MNWNLTPISQGDQSGHNVGMSERVISLFDLRNRPAVVPTTPIPATGLLGDQRGRPLRRAQTPLTAASGNVRYTFDPARRSSSSGLMG